MQFFNNTLILINNIDHGQHLFDLLSTALPHKQVYFIRGEVDVEERDRVKKVREDNNNVICIAISAIFSTGVNIKNLHMIIFAAGGKSFIRTVQSIGRGLRLSDNKEKLVIIDIADKLRDTFSYNELIFALTHSITDKMHREVEAKSIRFILTNGLMERDNNDDED